MNDTDKKKFGILMFGCGEYYGKTLSTGVIELYWQGLKNHSIDEVQVAVNHHMADPDSGQFMPKIADLIRALSGGKQTQSMQAWSKVDRAIRRVGPWESVCFDDPIIHRVLEDMGGWISLCLTDTEEELKFRMHEFQKRYQGYVLQGGVSEYPKYLTGRAEASNLREGYEVQPPLLLGDKPRAQAVFDGGGERQRLAVARAQIGGGENKPAAALALIKTTYSRTGDAEQ